MAGGYKVPRDGEVGLRAMFRDLQRQIDALRGAAKLTSATISKGGLNVNDGGVGSAGAREQITAAAGYQSFDSAGVVQTQIKNGRLTTSAGDFAGTVTGSNIVGGSIAIAQGMASTETQDFETVATGTVPPTGWTRTVVNASGTFTGGGVDFLTTGGNPNRRARLTSAVVPVGVSNQTTEVTGPGTIGTDFAVAFDYMWTGAAMSTILGPELGLVLRAPTAGEVTPGSVRLNFANGGTAFSDGSGSGSGTDAMTINVWYRVTVTLRGSTVRVQRVPPTGPALPDQFFTLVAANRPGRVEFRADTSGLNANSAVQSVSIDDVTIQVLQTGLSVTPDGNVTAERLIVNQSAQVPDPLMPTDAVNLRTLNATASPIASSQVALSSAASPSGSTAVTLAGLLVTVTSPGTTAVYEVSISADVTLSTATVNIIELLVDGVAQTAQIITGGAVSTRVAANKTWRITGLAAGSRTFTARTLSATASAVRDPHTLMLVKRTA